MLSSRNPLVASIAPHRDGQGSMLYAFEAFVLDVGRRELRRGSEHIAVEPQVFDLLVYLVENRDRVVSRDDLLGAIWGGRIVSDSAITNAINGARRAIGDSGEEQRLIHTAPRKGFRFIGVMREADVATPEADAPAAIPYWRSRFMIVASSAALLCTAMLAGSLWLRSDLSSSKIASQPTAFGIPRLPIALLPFDDLGSNTNQSPLAAGISEGLATDLSRNQSLLVRLPGRLFVQRDKPRDAREIGQELGVGYLIQGSILRADDRVRVAAQLVEAKTGTYLWAERFDSDTSNVLDQEEEIVGRIINTLYKSLDTLRADWSRQDPDAATLIFRAREITDISLSQDSYAQRVRLYEQALELAPGSLPAQIGLANTLAVKSWYMNPTDAKDDMHRAERLIKAGLVAAPNNADAHYTMGQVLRLQGRCEEAIGEYERAIALNRNIANADAFLASCLLWTGKTAAVIPLLEKAIRLDPSNKLGGWNYRRIGVAALFQSRDDDAISWLERARVSLAATEQRDALSATHSWLAAAYALKGDTGRATTELAQARDSGEYPKSIEQFCRSGQWCANPTVKAQVEATYCKGLRLAGWSEQ
jgi:TolB-like protein/DNA-binding winged helix-turn-helix (wHTH) protein